MDGKIPVLSRLLIISLLFVLSGNAYPDRYYSPGDVIFIPLDQSESLVDFYYKGNLMTKVLKDDQPIDCVTLDIFYVLRRAKFLFHKTLDLGNPHFSR